ncbi:hypothetical protein BKA70DRAFT_1487386 [Coprinopsis sp. MPI-PUGE-AT-0042]|nr:hypothetical protein BKA70DRAFT_1487386 [Coprinopsis sp. MPI-PUGE-AT-0042]
MQSESMDVDMGGGAPMGEPGASNPPQENTNELSAAPVITTSATPVPTRESNFRDVTVKVHIRRPEKDSWMYLGRGIASHEVTGHSSRVVVRAQSSGKIIVQFDETSDLQAEKRGNFVVIGMVDGSRVVSWSLNAPSSSDTLRLLASIELACYRCKQAVVDPRLHVKARRRIERIIKDDRRRRHRRRKDQDSMIEAFSKQTLSVNDSEAGPPPETGRPF